MLSDTLRQSKLGIFGSYGNQKNQRETHAMTHGELTHVLMLCIHHFEENSQVDPIHSSSEATSVPFTKI